MKPLLYALVSLTSLAFAWLSPPNSGVIEAHSAEVPQATMALLTEAGR